VGSEGKRATREEMYNGHEKKENRNIRADWGEYTKET